MKEKSTLFHRPSKTSAFTPYTVARSRELPTDLLRLIGDEEDIAREVKESAAVADLHTHESREALLRKIEQLAKAQIQTQEYLKAHPDKKIKCNRYQLYLLNAQPNNLQKIIKVAVAYHKTEGEKKELCATRLVECATLLGKLHNQAIEAQEPPPAPRVNRYIPSP